MTEFEFLSVLISIIFGLALTQIMSGAVRDLYSGKFGENQLVYTCFAIAILVVDWWASFSWNLNSQWSFDKFLVLVIWAMSHYGMAAALYPPDTNISWAFERRRRYFLIGFIAVNCFDILVTALRGAIFTPWFYLPFISHFILVSGIGAWFTNSKLHRLISWWFLISILGWGLMVRTLLSEIV